MSDIDEIVVRTPLDLAEAWAGIVAAGPPSRPVLSLMFLDSEGRPRREIVEIEDVPEEIDACEALYFAEAFSSLARERCPGGSVAALLHRPGRIVDASVEVEWAFHLAEAAQSFRLRWWPLHVSNAAGLRPITADDVAGSVRGDR